MKLTEKDAIWCKTQKQWDSIIKMFDLDILSTAFERYSKNCITPIQKEIITSYGEKKYYKSQGYTIHKAKDILKKSFKKDVLKRLEKIENSNVKFNISKMKPNFDYSDLDCDLPTKELEELPKKWCVKFDESHREIIINLLNWKSGIVTESGYLFSDTKKSYFLSVQKHMGYTEITFDQFKKWVLKEEENKIEHTEIPKFWCVRVNESNLKTISNYSKQDISFVENTFLCYDKKIRANMESYTEISFETFKKEILEKDSEPIISYDLPKLTMREVQVKVSSQKEANECAEIAKACGEEVDKEINSLMLFGNQVVFRKKELNNDFGVYAESNNFKTISLQELRERFGKTEIDWSKAGQYVKNTTDYFLITNGIHSEKYFEATPCNGNNKGVLKRGWIKSAFKLCTEQITLKNE